MRGPNGREAARLVRWDMVKTLELALARAAELPESVQEQLGRELLDRLAALADLRVELEIGIRQLDAGEGSPLDIEALIARARKGYAPG